MALLKYRSLCACLIMMIFSCRAAELPREFKVKILSSEFVYDTASFAQCHASTIVETTKGLLVSFFGGTHERASDVCIYTARKENGQWTPPRKVADGYVNDTLAYPTWNPVLFNIGKRLYLFYKKGPSPSGWWGMSMYSLNDGETWSKPERLADGLLGPIKDKPVRLSTGTILSPSSIEYNSGLWKAHIERSTDNGLTWQKIDIVSDDSIKIIQPTLLIHPDNSIQALFRSNQNVIMESWSRDDGLTWSKVKPTTVLNPNSGIDAVTTKSGLFLLVNNPLKSGKTWDAGRNRLDLYASNDGKNWVKVYELENHKKGEFSYPAIIQGKDGIIHITYTFNRTKIKHVSLTVERVGD